DGKASDTPEHHSQKGDMKALLPLGKHMHTTKGKKKKAESNAITTNSPPALQIAMPDADTCREQSGMAGHE
ncbi:Hypothetical predicted protein, partial [Pelobates cultripes]